MNSAQIIKLIEQQAGQLTSKIIKDLVADNLSTKNKQIALYAAYKGDVPIKKRTFANTNKVNEKLANDYRGDIVDSKIGYVYGHPISYSLDSEKNKSSAALDEFNSFLNRNSISNLDTRTARYASICGYGARLCYINKEGKESVMNLKPWETIFITDSKLDTIQFALIYYDLSVVDDSGKTKTVTKVEWYDNANVTYYIQESSGGDFNKDTSEPINPQPHLFDGIPVIRYANNEAMQGDFEKSENLIDAYDLNLSDIQNELEEFRLAYMGFSGDKPPTQEIIDSAKQTGAFFSPTGSKVEFITKNLEGATNLIENHKKTLNENIYKFSKAVDMRDESFAGQGQSGESRKWKLVTMENDAITKESEFRKSNLELFKVLSTAWNKKSIPINPDDISQQFTRNLPVELLYYADVSTKLKGNISDETRLSLMPFIPDSKTELEKIKAESESMVNSFVDLNTADDANTNQ